MTLIDTWPSAVNMNRPIGTLSPNLQAALKRVRQNKSSPGIDGMTVDQLRDYLREHWVRLREQLLAGRYVPGAVRRHLIPKSGGGVRELGHITRDDQLPAKRRCNQTGQRR
jgi:retron-type reverse transcriptase